MTHFQPTPGELYRSEHPLAIQQQPYDRATRRALAFVVASAALAATAILAGLLIRIGRPSALVPIASLIWAVAGPGIHTLLRRPTTERTDRP